MSSINLATFRKCFKSSLRQNAALCGNGWKVLFFSGIHSCFVCKKSDTTTVRCSVALCGKYYHQECIEKLPQTKIEGKSVQCPLHVCHTCMASNAKCGSGRANGIHIFRLLLTEIKIGREVILTHRFVISEYKISRNVHQILCCGYSLESSCQEDSNEYPQHWSGREKCHYSSSLALTVPVNYL